MRNRFQSARLSPTVTFSKLGFWGQFGNQLFQIAAVLGYAEKFGNRPQLPRWVCSVSGAVYENYFPWIRSYYGLPVGQLYREPNFQYEDVPKRQHIDLRGNFQSERYFCQIRNRIRDLYAEPGQIKEALDAYCAENHLKTFNALHVRFYKHATRDLGPLEILPLKYFKRAVKILGAEVPLVVATDNKSRLADFLERVGLRQTVHVLKFDNPLMDFYVLSRSDKIAISNSSFSWWAAYLGNPKSQIIAPHRYYWFNVVERKNPFWNTTDLYPAKFEEQIF